MKESFAQATNSWKKSKESGNMKTLKKLWVAASVAAITMTGCQEESFDERSGSDNYYASVETFGTGTKTALGEGRSVIWSSEDRIAIFEGNGAGQAYQVLDSYVGKSSGEFAEIDGLIAEGTGSVIEGTIAVYPFNESLTVTSAQDGNYAIEGITFPAEQKYISGSFSEEAFPMAAISPEGSKSLSFKNIGGVLKLSLTGSYSVSKITLEGNSGEPLSGTATVTLGSDGIPSVQMSEDASTSVSLTCDPAVQLDPETATDFYISIPPTEFEAGFSVTVTDSEGTEYTKDTGINNRILRSRILVMPMLGNSDLTILKLAENAKIYNEEQTEYFLTAESGKIIIDPSAPEDDIPQVGEIIICPITEATPNGYIGKVVTHDATASGIEVQTEAVPLHEAFEELHISTTIDMAPYITSAKDGDGNSLDFRMVKDGEWPQTSPQTKAEATGNLNFALKVENDEFKGEIYQSNSFNVDIDISLSKINRFDISIEKKSGIKGEWELTGLEGEEFKHILGKLQIESAPIPIPGTPVTIVPALYTEIFFERKAEVSLTAELGLLLEHQQYSFSYNNGNPVSEAVDLLTEPKTYFQFNSLEAKGEMALGMSGGVKMAFWNEALLALGTEVTAKGTVGLGAEVSMEDKLLRSNVKASLTPSLTTTIYAESFLFERYGAEDGKIKNDIASLDIDILEIYALPRFSNIETSTEGLEMTAAADVDKLSLIWCEEKGFALFEKNGEKALKHIAFDNPEPNLTTNRDTSLFTLPSTEKEYIAKPYVLAFGKYYYGKADDRWVDLGLPSGILWAKYNVGASSPEEYGGYYAWGETEEKSTYTWENYKYREKQYEGGDSWWTGAFIGSEISSTSYDVAHVQWGEGARMPTLAEIKELLNYCSFTVGTYNSVKGTIVTGPNGNSIFLPFAGYQESDDLYGEGNCGFFWSGTNEEGDTSDACHLNCFGDGDYYRDDVGRFLGLSVRPVKDK